MGLGVVGYQANLPPVTPASLMVTSSCSSCFISDPAVCLWLGKIAEGGLNPWPCIHWEIWKKLFALCFFRSAHL